VIENVQVAHCVQCAQAIDKSVLGFRRFSVI